MRIAIKVLFITLSASASTMLLGCYPPRPYVNPLPPQQVQSLKISKIKFDPNLPWDASGPDYQDNISLIKTTILNRLIERLGDRYDTKIDGATLTIKLFHIRRFGGPARPEEVSIGLSAILNDGEFKAHYSVDNWWVGHVRTAYGEIEWNERIPIDASNVTDGIVNAMLSTPEENQKVGYCTIYKPNSPLCSQSPLHSK